MFTVLSTYLLTMSVQKSKTSWLIIHRQTPRLYQIIFRMYFPFRCNIINANKIFDFGAFALMFIFIAHTTFINLVSANHPLHAHTSGAISPKNLMCASATNIYASFFDVNDEKAIRDTDDENNKLEYLSISIYLQYISLHGCCCYA